MVALSIFASPVILAAWVVPFNPVSGTEFVKHADKLREAMITGWLIRNDGTIYDAGDWTPERLKAVNGAGAKNHVRMYLTLSNWTPDDFDPKRLNALFAEPKRTEGFKYLAEQCRKNHWQGVDLDIESLDQSQRAAYTEYVQKAAALLHARQLRLSVTVHPKTSEPGNWSGPQAQDWKAISRAADDLRIMGYDYSWSTGPAGPIAPSRWVDDLVRFGLTQAEKSKISMGVPWYGYDWNKNPATSLTWDDLPKKPFTLDPASDERVYDPKLYFAGAEAFRRASASLEKLGIHRMSAWYCGSGDPACWDFVK